MYFDNCKLMINGSGMIAENADFSTENTLSPNYSLGYNGPISYSATGPVKASLQANYYPRLIRDVNFDILTAIKTGLENPTPVEIGLAGISGRYYLQGLSFRAIPNQPIKASVSYISFNEISGSYVTDTFKSGDYGEQNLDIFLHGWTTWVSEQGAFLSSATLDFSYDFSINMLPIYTLGSQFPSQINILGATERIDLTREQFYNLNYHGEDASIQLFNTTGVQEIKLQGLAFFSDPNQSTSYVFNLKDAQITNTKVAATLDDIVRITTSIVKNY